MNFRKTSTSASLTTLKPLTVWITTHWGKFFKRWEYQITLPVSWEICMRVKKQQLEPYLEQLTGAELGKEYDKAVCCYPACLTSMQSVYLYTKLLLLLLLLLLSRFSRVRFCDPMECSPPGSSVHGILQARILERIAMFSSKWSSWPWDWTFVFGISCIGRQVPYH